MDEPTSPAPSDEPPGALPEVAPDDLTPAASAPPEAQPAMAGQRLGGADYLAVVALTGLFGAVCGTHILGLLAGHARFITTQEIETLVPPLSLAAAPVPVALWPTDQWLAQIAQIGHHPLMLAVTALAGAVAALAVVRLMNPGLGSALLARRIERWRVLIAVLASVAVIVAALWPLPDPVMRTQFPTSRAALAGALVWLLWHRQGWLHPTAEPPGLLSIIRQLVSGALLGLVAHTRLRHVLTAADVEILRGWLDGGFQRALVWRELALYAVGVRCLGGLFAGTVACALAPVGVRLRDRVRWLAMPVLVVSVVLFIVGARWQRVWLHQYQWGRPLFRAARIHQPFAEVAAEHCTGLFGGPRGVVIVRPCLERTVLGLRTTDEVAAACRRLLEATDARTLPARSAFIQLHDTVADRWDVAETLVVQQAQVSSPGASPIFAALLLESLGHAAWLPAGDAAVRRLADPRVFTWPTAQSRAELLRLAWRWGRLDIVPEAVRRAEPKVMAELAAQPVPRHDGVVTGRILRSGQPWPEVQVGLLPDQVLPVFVGPPSPSTPFMHRLIAASARTGPDGSFRLEHVFTGDYYLLLKLPVADLSRGAALFAPEVSGQVKLTAAAPTVELGTLKIELRRRPGQMVGVGWDEARRGKTAVTEAQF